MYRELYKRAILFQRMEKAISMLESCELCPRKCKVNRLKNQIGFCKTGRNARIASYHAYFGEEAILAGTGGTGGIYFGSCNLQCSFCNEYEISHFNQGTEIDSILLARIMMDLQNNGCHNINLINPSHMIPQILEALPIAIDNGLSIPIIYNSGGYDTPESLRLLKGVVRIYLPDFKCWSSKASKNYMSSEDYPQKAKEAIKEMHKQVGDLTFTDGIASKGLLVRHSILPGYIDDSKKILDFILNDLSPNTYVHLKKNYTPHFKAKYSNIINRRLKKDEFLEVIHYAESIGLKKIIH